MKALKMLVRRFARGAFALLPTALSLTALTVPVQATTIASLTLEQQVRKADLVLYVRVLGAIQENRTLGRETFPWQVYTLEVLESLVGDAAALPQKNGKPTLSVLGGVDLTLEGVPTLKAPKDKDPGGEYLLLLYRTPYDSPFVGFNQGVYAVVSDKVQNLPGNRTELGEAGLTAFKNKLISLRGGQ